MDRSPITTITEPGGSEFTVQGSRFIGQVRAVGDEATVTRILEEVREDHPDATHVVSAYRLAGPPTTAAAEDDGEPGGSAGEPVLHVLEANDLLDVLAIVIRYFGGTELGYGGLVRAYSRATTEALEAATVEERSPQESLAIIAAYEDSGTVRSVLESEGVTFEGTYEERVRFDVAVPADELPALRERLRSATNDRIAFNA